MKINGDLPTEFKETFQKEFGVELSEKETKEAAGNLVNFFYLLWQFDQEDKQKNRENYKNQNIQ